MPRGYRCILVAFVGWLSLAAEHPDPTANTQQNQTADAVTKAAQNVLTANDEQAERAHRLKYEAECNPATEKRDSDLCAQWKAADATRDAAWWTALGTLASALSGMLVLLAIGLAYQANRIARSTARLQLRAYLSHSDYPIVIVPSGSNSVGLRITSNWKNSGSTPALQVRDHFCWKEFKGPIPDDFDFPDDCDAPRSGPSVVGPGMIAYGFANPIPAPVVNRVAAKKTTVLVWGWAEYLDIFGDARRVEIAATLYVGGRGVNRDFRMDSYHRHNGMDETCYKQPTNAHRKRSLWQRAVGAFAT